MTACLEQGPFSWPDRVATCFLPVDHDGYHRDHDLVWEDPPVVAIPTRSVADPQHWPVCVTMEKNGSTCQTPYVLRRLRILAADGQITSAWGWQPGCKHKIGSKNHHAEIHNVNGRVVP